jgi:hypothetical protein
MISASAVTFIVIVYKEQLRFILFYETLLFLWREDQSSRKFTHS